MPYAAKRREKREKGNSIRGSKKKAFFSPETIASLRTDEGRKIILKETRKAS